MQGDAFAEGPGVVSRLVDSVYSAVCGGFTEDNDAVWGGPPDPSLRGRPDFPPDAVGMDVFAAGIVLFELTCGKRLQYFSNG